MAKHPYIPLYTGDWLKDPAVTLCTPATRGVWIDLICAMHELDRSGELRGTADQLARAARCSTVEFVQAMTDIQTTGAADVTERNGAYVVRNRRMYVAAQKRKSNADRQLRLRNKDCSAENNGDVALYDNDIENEFEEFWESFPRGRKQSKPKAREAFDKAVAKEKVTAEIIIAAAKAYAASDVGRGKFVKMPSTWLNQECWHDDRAAWRDLDGKPVSSSSELQRKLATQLATREANEAEKKRLSEERAANPICLVGELQKITQEPKP